MFDTINLRAGDQHHHRSEVHEHRAPTDASVRLLREMEQAVGESIARQILGPAMDRALRMRQFP